MMNTLKPWLVLAVIFVAGVLSGVALTLALSPHFHHPPNEAQISKRIMARLTSELALTPDQQQKIQPVIEESAKELREVRTEEVRRVTQIIKLTNEQMAPFLTAEQKKRLDELQAEGDNTMFGRMHSWGPGEHMHGSNEPGGGPPWAPPGGPSGGPPPPPNGAPPPPPPATNAPDTNAPPR